MRDRKRAARDARLHGEAVRAVKYEHMAHDRGRQRPAWMNDPTRLPKRPPERRA